MFRFDEIEMAWDSFEKVLEEELPSALDVDTLNERMEDRCVVLIGIVGDTVAAVPLVIRGSGSGYSRG
jgi:hypothetical protein